ncbi:MAG: OmpH family outer membrane protein [Bacteroidia bacterium]|nr:OmpH family outer membrane protein [Bacteroidia bacterium]
MRLASLILLSILTFAGQSFAQTIKIGYADIQAVLSRMPETKTMQQTLQSYEQKLAEKLQSKQQYAQTKLQEYMELREGGADQATLAPLEAELQKLDQEISAENTDAETKLMTRRQDLLQPIIDKLQAGIDAIAAEDGYSFIMSKVDGTGSSLVLYGPEEYDVTLKLMKKLNIPTE